MFCDRRQICGTDIVKSVAATFGTKVQVDISDAILTPRAALGLSLVLHELMTNAVKYGSLRHEGGSVTLRAAHSSANDSYSITWTERGGPPVQIPTRRGFGTMLTEQLLVNDLHGACEFTYEPEGLRCTMDIPASELLAAVELA